MSRSAPSSGPSRSAERGVIAGLLRLIALAALVGAIAVGVLLFAPTTLDDLEPPSPVDDGSLPIEPPPSDGEPRSDDESPPGTDGEHEPESAHPDDPNGSTHETGAESVTASAVEDAVHAEVNDRRAEHGLEPIARDATIASVSRAHSADMAEHEYFDHTNLDGQGPYDRFTDIDDYCRAYGENLALSRLGMPLEAPSGDGVVEHRTAAELGAGLVEQWMHSPGHRAAILDDGWDRGGVGVHLTDEGAAYATHNFCTTR